MAAQLNKLKEVIELEVILEAAIGAIALTKIFFFSPSLANV